MNLTQKIFAGVGVAALATVAAFPHVKAYIDSLPKQLNKEQAAKRYLDLACPTNKIQDYRMSLQKKLNKEYSVIYWDSDALANANNRVGALETRLKIASDALAKEQERKSKESLNPKYIWPVEVQKDIKFMSEQDFKDAGLYGILKKEGREMTKEEQAQDQKDSLAYTQAASRIRQTLGLPPVGQGCNAK